MDAAEVRRIALARGKRFGSMLAEDGIDAAIACWPDACRPIFFAGRVASVRAAYRALPEGTLAGLLEEAWARRAPSSLLRR